MHMCVGEGKVHNMCLSTCDNESFYVLRHLGLLSGSGRCNDVLLSKKRGKRSGNKFRKSCTVSYNT